MTTPKFTGKSGLPTAGTVRKTDIPALVVQDKYDEK
jgi:hypothetical protein